EQPVAKVEPQQEKISFELSDETREMIVKDPVEVIPVTEVSENGIIKYSLEQYMELENDLIASKPDAKVQEPVSPELDLKVRKVEDTSFTPAFEEVSPMEMSIEETLKFRADE